MADEEEELTPLNPDEPDVEETTEQTPETPAPAEETPAQVSDDETVQVPTAINPDTWPEKTGTVTDPEILASQGLAPDEPEGDVAGTPESEEDDPVVQDEAPPGAEWFQCLVGNLPTKHKFWSVDHLKDPPERVSCPECGSQTVIRSEGYVAPAFLRT